MRDAGKRTIDGVIFEVTPLGYREGRKAFVRLSKAVGPALAQASSGGDMADLSGSDVDVAAALSALVSEVSDGDLEWFADILGKTTRFSRGGDKWPYLVEANREALFAGEILLFFKWLAFALEVNFSDFLSFLRPAKSGDGLEGPE